jgi:hypothetical protein
LVSRAKARWVVNAHRNPRRRIVAPNAKVTADVNAT